MLSQNTTISWTFCDENGNDIVIEFMLEDKLTQRNC